MPAGARTPAWSLFVKMPKNTKQIPARTRVQDKLRRTAREQRWSDARRVIAIGVDLLSHPEDRYLRGRFNQIVDRINKQVAAGLSDQDLVFDAVARGARSLDRLRDVTLLSRPDLEAVIAELEAQGRLRQVSKSIVEIRDKSRERYMVLKVMRSRPGSTTLEDLRDATGFSRRHISQIVAELQEDQKIVRTRTGFIPKAVAQAARPLKHDDDCLCRICLTPRHKLAAAQALEQRRIF